MAAHPAFRRPADTLPPPGEEDVYAAQTAKMNLPSRLVAAMMAAETAAVARALFTQRRRRMDMETLDRANPFLHPSPESPWAPSLLRTAPDGFTAAELRAELATRTREPARHAELVELVVVVWAVVVGLVLCAFAMNG